MNNSPEQSGLCDLPEIIFLVSQPRAGSTLLQKLLAAHSDVATTSEPWIMLPAASVFREGASNADFNADWAAAAMRSFIETLPNGQTTYIEGLRRMYGYVYGQALSATESRVFLDKTPRYYLIIPQLREIFPDARIILLLRNPLAVLVSIISTWEGIGPRSLQEFKHDLLTAPKLLNEAIGQGSEQLIVVRYEELLSDPETSLRQLCQALHLEFEDQILQYEGQQDDKWALGDQKKVYEECSVDQANRDKWVDSLNDPAIWRVCSDYLNQLGEGLYSSLGYDWNDAQALLAAHRPGLVRKTLTLSLEHCFKPPDNAWLRIPGIRKAGKQILSVLSMTRTPH